MISYTPNNFGMSKLRSFKQWHSWGPPQNKSACTSETTKPVSYRMEPTIRILIIGLVCVCMYCKCSSQLEVLRRSLTNVHICSLKLNLLSNQQHSVRVGGREHKRILDSVLISFGPPTLTLRQLPCCKVCRGGVGVGTGANCHKDVPPKLIPGSLLF